MPNTINIESPKGNTINIELPEGNTINMSLPEGHIVSVIADPIVSVSIDAAFGVNQGVSSGNGTKFDAHYAQTFTNLSWSPVLGNYQMTVAHNLGKFPSVQVIDSVNNIVVPQITFVNANSVTFTAQGPFSGKVYFN